MTEPEPDVSLPVPPARPLVIVGIGPPSSGKTTVLEPVAHMLGAAYISTDQIRDRWFGGSYDRDRNRDVFAYAYAMLHRALEAGRTVVWDATNARGAHRRELLEACRMGGRQVRVVGWWWATPLEVCLARNRSRPRPVEEADIRRMHAQLATGPPVLAEGWDAIEITRLPASGVRERLDWWWPLLHGPVLPPAFLGVLLAVSAGAWPDTGSAWLHPAGLVVAVALLMLAAARVYVRQRHRWARGGR